MKFAAALLASVLSASAGAQTAAPPHANPARVEWNAPQKPFRIFGNTYYVGPHGLASILITSRAGDVLIDGDLPESAPLILANIRALGFDPHDIKLILNSHAHYDHAGGIGEIQRATGAAVAASPWSAKVIEAGKSLPGDPQFGIADPFPPAVNVRVIEDNEVLRVGPLALTAHSTPGHTPGGTSWTWRSCDAGICRDFAYVDSQSPVSADDFLFTNNTSYPSALSDFDRGLSLIAKLPCDILLTPHPDASGFWQRVATRDSGKADALVDSTACRRFADAAREQIARRVARERGGSGGGG